MDKFENNHFIYGYSRGLSSEQEGAIKRKKVIAIAAYFRAEKRGFAPNGELEDWFEAELEIQRHLDSFSS